MTLKPLFETGKMVLRETADPTVSSILTGDICLAHGVEQHLLQMGKVFFSPVKPLLKTDILVGNLATPLVAKAQVDSSRGGIKSRAELADGLFQLGFDAFCLANNHTMDCGPEGLRETTALLYNYSVRHFGAGENIREARQPLLVEQKGIKIAFLGYSQPELDFAQNDRPGTASLRRKLILEDVTQVRNKVDILIVSLHEGFEFSKYPRPDFISFCRELIDIGVTIIYGHHPHVLQGVERYRNGIVFYSLGNFIFDMPGHRDNRWSRTGLLVRVEMDKKGLTSVELLTTVLTPECYLKPADPQERRDILQHLNEISELLGIANFIRRENGVFLRKTIKTLLRTAYLFGREDQKDAFDNFCEKQIYRDPYLKIFHDFALLAGDYRPLAKNS